MKKTISTTRKYIYALLICCSLFIPAFVFFAIDENSPIAIGIIIVMSFGLMILIPTFGAHLLKKLSGKILSRHKKYESAKFQKTSPRVSSPYKIHDTRYVASNGLGVSWYSVFLTMLVLFPLGIYYMIRKVSHEKKRYLSNGIIMTVVGSVFVVFSVPILSLLIATGADNLRSLLLLAVLPAAPLLTGLGMIISGITLQRKGHTYQKFLTLITEYEITNLDDFKVEFNMPYSKVTSTLQKMIDIGFLSDSYIYHKDRELIVPGISKKIALKCKTCMGTTVLYSNEERICAYCGGEL